VATEEAIHAIVNVSLRTNDRTIDDTTTEQAFESNEREHFPKNELTKAASYSIFYRNSFTEVPYSNNSNKSKSYFKLEQNCIHLRIWWLFTTSQRNYHPIRALSTSSNWYSTVYWNIFMKVSCSYNNNNSNVILSWYRRHPTLNLMTLYRIPTGLPLKANHLSPRNCKRRKKDTMGFGL